MVAPVLPTDQTKTAIQQMQSIINGGLAQQITLNVMTAGGGT